MKRWIAWALALSLLCGALPLSAAAADMKYYRRDFTIGSYLSKSTRLRDFVSVTKPQKALQQEDLRWQAWPYGEGGLGRNGGGLFSYLNLTAFLTGKVPGAKDVQQALEDLGEHYTFDSLASADLARNTALKWTDSTYDLTEKTAKQAEIDRLYAWFAASEDHYAVLSTYNRNYREADSEDADKLHFIAVAGVTEDGRLLIMDSTGTHEENYKYTRLLDESGKITGYGLIDPKDIVETWDLLAVNYLTADPSKMALPPRVTVQLDEKTHELFFKWNTYKNYSYHVTMMNENDAVAMEDVEYITSTTDQYAAKVEDNHVYSFTVRTTLDTVSPPADRAETTVYVSVNLFNSGMTEAEKQEQALKTGYARFAQEASRPNTEAYNLLQILYQDLDSSYVVRYLGDLDGSLAYQLSSFGYQWASDPIGTAIDTVSDWINDPTEVMLVSALTEYLLNGDSASVEGWDTFYEKASFISDGFSAIYSSTEAGVEAERKLFGALYDTMNSLLPKLNVNLADDSLSGLRTLATSNSKFGQFIEKNSKAADDTLAAAGGVLAVFDFAVQHGRNQAVLQALTGNYLENMKKLAALHDAAHEPKMRRAIEKLADRMSNEFFKNFGQLVEEGNEVFDWFAQLAFDSGVKALGETAAGSVLSGILLGQAIGKLVTGAADDFIKTNRGMAEAHKAAKILQKEMKYAASSQDPTLLEWAEIYISAVHKMVDTAMDNKQIAKEDYLVYTIQQDRQDVMDHRAALVSRRVDLVIAARQEINRISAWKSGITVYEAPVQATLGNGGVVMVFDQPDENSILVHQFSGTVQGEIIGERVSTLTQEKWYFIRAEGYQGYVVAEIAHIRK